MLFRKNAEVMNRDSRPSDTCASDISEFSAVEPYSQYILPEVSPKINPQAGGKHGDESRPN
jgi:hypothetical protein